MEDSEGNELILKREWCPNCENKIEHDTYVWPYGKDGEGDYELYNKGWCISFYCWACDAYFDADGWHDDPRESNREHIPEIIKAWDKRDIRHLNKWIRHLKKFGYDPFEVLDMSNLPTEESFNGIDLDYYSAYPIWAMDKNGFCIVGNGQDFGKIEHIEKIKEWYNSDCDASKEKL